uniref:SH3 domain-containing protein n=1 Tax=Trichobilharzia regenti TaxID=157069 RepID=A0AA85J9V2_TRIRE|nr:unnamed protein product [Trichobilharzia regenti]
MLRALYAYPGPFPGTLKFSQNEIFLDIREENQDWRLVSRTDGTLGCVPSNFVVKYETEDENIKVECARNALVNLYDKTVEIWGKEDLLRRLLQISGDKRMDTIAPDDVKSSGDFSELKITDPKERIPQAETKSDKYTPTERNIILPKNFEYRLLDTIRLATNCSYSDCGLVYSALMGMLSCVIPGMKENLQADKKSTDVVKTEEEYSQSPDWWFLKIKFRFFESRQSNDQECNWRLHDDQYDILERLNELITLLERSDHQLVVCYLRVVEYRSVRALIGLYQRETNQEIRGKLLRCIGICCSLDSACIHICLESVLPAELVREIRCTTEEEIPQLALRLRFLSMLIARSPSLPVDLSTSLDRELFGHLMKLCDSTSSTNSTLIDLENFTDHRELSTTNNNNNSADGDSGNNNNNMNINISNSNEQSRQCEMLSYTVTVFFLACNWHFNSSVYTINSPSKNDPTDSVCVKNSLLEALLSESISSRLFLEIVIQTFNRNFDPTFMVTFLPKHKNDDRESCLIQWVNYCQSTVHDSCIDDTSVSTTTTAKGFEEFLQVFEANSRADPNTHNDLEYIESLWNSNLGSRHASSKELMIDTKPVLSNHHVNSSTATPTNTVIKFLCDLFYSPDTSALIYHNDFEVIIEVINRQLRDLEPDSEDLPHFLLLLGIMSTSSCLTERDSAKIHDTIDALKSIIQSVSHSTSCKTLALAVCKRLNTIVQSFTKQL